MNEFFKLTKALHRAGCNEISAIYIILLAVLAWPRQTSVSINCSVSSVGLLQLYFLYNLYADFHNSLLSSFSMSANTQPGHNYGCRTETICSQQNWIRLFGSLIFYHFTRLCRFLFFFNTSTWKFLLWHYPKGKQPFSAAVISSEALQSWTEIAAQVNAPNKVGATVRVCVWWKEKFCLFCFESIMSNLRFQLSFYRWHCSLAVAALSIWLPTVKINKVDAILSGVAAVSMCLISKQLIFWI